MSVHERIESGHAGWAVRVGFVLFFLLLFVPTAYTPLKGALLALVLAAVVGRALLQGHLPVHRTIVFLTLLYVAIGLAFMFRGLVNGAPGALRMGTVYALWPLVYLLLIAGMADRHVLHGLLRVVVIATVAIGLYGFSYTLYAAGVWPKALYLPLDQGQRIGFYEGFVEFNLYSLASLLFAVPFIIGALFVWPRRGAPASRRLMWIALIIGVGLVALSARRALLLAVAVAPVFAMALRLMLPRAERRATRAFVVECVAGGVLAVIGLSLALHFVYGLSFGAIADMFGRGFQFQSYTRATERTDQVIDLMNGWLQSPLLGAGHGAAAAGWPRDLEMPWSYELSYVALLFHTGLLGLVAYASGVVWIVWTGVRVIRTGGLLARYITPVLVGMICFLIGNAADPYLEKFDYLWVIFLPLAIINVWFLRRPSTESHATPPIAVMTHDRGP
jgi:hypothetical protein